MIELPPPGEVDLEAAARITETLLCAWQSGAETLPDYQQPSTAHLVDLCAVWMLRLHTELRAARLARRIQEQRRRHLERLLDRMQRRLQPRLRRALHERLRGNIFTLRLRRRRTNMPLAWAARVEIE